ncbi:N-acetyltransferase [uncultured Paraglaciecola sp.]|jgi:ribosomal protein S18 acetylase RimI-like enzyme|uniref:GNAT family N-acetyltransferase n=1 Tax=uncultured Paraglaciecola sp. TaxID=1765024 RepID=UPI0025D6AEA5|nr:N-acetyltransferase [uncultured Paraglaciecola sp.]
MIIRQATINDTAAIADFNIKMAKETEDLALIPDVINAGVRNMIENPAMGFYLVAEDNHVIQASLMVTTEWSDWRNGLFWWIQSVYVQPQYRRMGLYSKLYEKVKNLAQDNNNVCGFRLYVEHENVTAQKTYRSLGMEKTDYQMFEEAKSVIKIS